MGYRDSDESGFSRHGMNRDHHNDQHDPLQHQRSHRAGWDYPDLGRDEDLRTAHSVPLGRGEAAGGGSSAQDAGRDFIRDRYEGPDNGGRYRNADTGGYGYGAHRPDIGGYAPYESERRQRQQYGGARYDAYGDGGYGQGQRGTLNGPDEWAREGYGGGYDSSQGRAGSRHGTVRQGRSYGYGFDGRPHGDYGAYGLRDGNGPQWSSRQDVYGGSEDRYQGGNIHPDYPSRYQGRQRHDPEYSAWRQEQLRLLDEDYDAWRRERYEKFSDEFNTWRGSRSRNEGLRSSNQTDQADPAAHTASAVGGNKVQQSGGSTSHGGTTGGTAASGKARG